MATEVADNATTGVARPSSLGSNSYKQSVTMECPAVATGVTLAIAI